MNLGRVTPKVAGTRGRSAARFHLLTSFPFEALRFTMR